MEAPVYLAPPPIDPIINHTNVTHRDACIYKFISHKENIIQSLQTKLETITFQYACMAKLKSMQEPTLAYSQIPARKTVQD